MKPRRLTGGTCASRRNMKGKGKSQKRFGAYSSAGFVEGRELNYVGTKSCTLESKSWGNRLISSKVLKKRGETGEKVSGKGWVQLRQNILKEGRMAQPAPVERGGNSQSRT